jgi:hypothetical protein
MTIREWMLMAVVLGFAIVIAMAWPRSDAPPATVGRCPELEPMTLPEVRGTIGRADWDALVRGVEDLQKRVACLERVGAR